MGKVLHRTSVESVSSVEPSPKDSSEAPRGEDHLHRKLSTRQVSMIAMAGVIGTGLYLSSGKSLAKAGPGSMLICYIIMGIIVYVTMLSLGEMTTYMPVSGSFCTYTMRFIDPAAGFAMYWNYWFNDALTPASDLTALQLIIEYWNISIPSWSVAFIFWFVLLGINLVDVRVYGEVEYWLAILKVVSIIVFMILSIVVNAGANTDHEYLGFKYWHLEGAPLLMDSGGLPVSLLLPHSPMVARRAYLLPLARPSTLAMLCPVPRARSFGVSSPFTS